MIFTTSALPGTQEQTVTSSQTIVMHAHPTPATHLPPMQASCRGEVVREERVGFTLAPCSSSILTQSKLPTEQASHRGVLPSVLRASTYKTTQPSYVLINYKEHITFSWSLTCVESGSHPSISMTRYILYYFNYSMANLPHLLPIFLLSLSLNLVTVSPVLQHPVAAWHIGSAPFHMPHGGGW